MHNRLTDAIKAARQKVRVERKTFTVFKRDGTYGVMSLEDWLNAELWDRGAEQVCNFTQNAEGKVV